MFPVFLFTFQVFNRGFYLVTGSGEPTYTLSEAVEKLGFGKFQMKIIWMVGFFVVSTLVLFHHHYHHHRHVIIIINIIIIVIIIIIVVIVVIIITIITKLINASVANRALVVILLHSFQTILATFIGMPPLNSCSPALHLVCSSAIYAKLFWVFLLLSYQVIAFLGSSLGCILNRLVAMISNRWDYSMLMASRYCGLHCTLKRKSSQFEAFVIEESQAFRRVFYPASGYYLRPC